MVWSFAYEPLGSHSPLAEIVEGNTGHLELVDDTPDGGIKLRGSGTSSSGRPVKPETVPKVICWRSKQKIGDLCGAVRKTVSDRLREVIEEIEPDTHQFVPVEFIAEDGSHLERRWFWQICNRLDSVHHEKTEHVLYKGLVWMAPPLATSKSPSKHVFDNCQIKNAKFWHDKHISGSSFCADHVRIQLDDAGVTGIRFKHYDQA